MLITLNLFLAPLTGHAVVDYADPASLVVDTYEPAAFGIDPPDAPWRFIDEDWRREAADLFPPDGSTSEHEFPWQILTTERGGGSTPGGPNYPIPLPPLDPDDFGEDPRRDMRTPGGVPFRELIPAPPAVAAAPLLAVLLLRRHRAIPS